MHKALFLDRDGVINIDHGYTYQIKNFEFTKDIFKLLKLFQKKDYLFFIVTNQSGIGRGYYTQEDYNTLTQWLLTTFHQKGITIEKVYHCSHAPEENCHCRKPEIGMMEQCLKEYNIDFTQSWMIGDKQSDIDFAQHTNIAHSIAIGERKIENAEYYFTSISECAHYLEENQGKIL
jgi:D-glycero-D-manno-heptose 1,7-bisphosphate phosphatase